MEELDDLPLKRRRVTATSPVQVALQIRKKYHRLQQRHSPLSATARRLLLGKVGGGDGADATRTRASQIESLCHRLRDEYPELRVEKNVEPLTCTRTLPRRDRLLYRSCAMI